MNSATSLLMSVSWPVTMPQCPCDMYSQRQTSPISSRPGTSRLMARVAFCTIPLSAQAPVATSSFDSGSPKRMTLGMPSDLTFAHAFAGADEKRIDETFGAEAGFADKRAHRVGAAQAAGTISWECHNSKF